MLVQAFTVFLALIGTTLSCLSTGARVTYAMGRDDEVPSHFGMLHGKTLTPHRAIWTLAVISAVIGIVTVVGLPGRHHAGAARSNCHNFWYSFGIFTPETFAKLPNTLVIVTLVSNFGTFLLYMITCIDRDRGLPASTTPSTASSTWSCRSSAWWPTWSACSSTSSARSRWPA